MLTPSIAQPETSERFRITSKRGFIYKRPIMCTLFSSLPIIVYHCIPGLAHEEKDRGIYQNMSDLVKKRLLPGISEIISCFATIFMRTSHLPKLCDEMCPCQSCTTVVYLDAKLFGGTCDT